MRLWWYDAIDLVKRGKEAAPFFTIQIDVARIHISIALVLVMEADVLCAVGKRDDGDFFCLRQLYIVAWSFQFRHMLSELKPDVGR